jgi:hypothetical protein
MSKLSRRRLAPVAALNFEPLKVTNEENERSLGEDCVPSRSPSYWRHRECCGMPRLMITEPLGVACFLFAAC